MVSVDTPKNMPAYKPSISNKQQSNNNISNEQHTKTCNCRIRNECPVDNKCMISDVIYMAEVHKYNDNNEIIELIDMWERLLLASKNVTLTTTTHFPIRN